jgi:hypothetical protein
MNVAMQKLFMKKGKKEKKRKEHCKKMDKCPGE